MNGELVLVTGGSGFVATHCILQLLSAGYRVRATLRSLSREAEVRTMLATGGALQPDWLTFAAADLTADTGWREAAEGCRYVLHVASPFPPSLPKNEEELIRPAREGALRVLRAARQAGVQRVVLTSSFAAIGYGTDSAGRTYTETDWTDLNGSNISSYVKSKTLAERAAWDFMQQEGRPMELAVVNPVGIFGPVLGADYSASIQIVQRLMDGSIPGCPRWSFGIVDVRDVADLHLRAMTNPAAKDQRFLAVSGDFMSIQEIALTLKARLGDAARRVPTRMLPDWLVRMVALFDHSVGYIVPELGKIKHASNEKARRVLGWQPRSREDAVTATAESMIRLGLLKIARKPASGG